MATSFFNFNYLVPQDFQMRGETFDEGMAHFATVGQTDDATQGDELDLDIEEYYRRCEVTDPASLESVTNGSRRGWLIYALQQLHDAAAMPGLKVLSGADDFPYDWEASETFDDDKGRIVEWCRWKAVTLREEKLTALAQEITRMFDWLREHIGDKAVAIFSEFSSQEELMDNLLAPVLSRDTALDRRIWYAEEGDGPHCLFSYLHSMRQLCMNAHAQGAGVLLLVQTPK